MNLHRVSLFAEVVKEGGFTAAAKSLGLPKSAVSAGVARLEAELDAQLLVRAGRRVTLTEAGAALYARAAPALELLSESEQTVRDMREALEGRIRITAPPGLGTQLLAPVVSQFLREHPGIRIEALFTMRAVDLTGEGFDLALRAGQVVDEDLIARQIGWGQAGLFATPDYLAQNGTPQDIADLSGRDLLLLGSQSCAERPIELQGPQGSELVRAKLRLVADHLPFVLAATLDGAGIGLLPCDDCAADLAAGRLVRLLPDYGLRLKPIYLVYPRHGLMVRRVSLLRERILAHCAERGLATVTPR